MDWRLFSAGALCDMGLAFLAAWFFKWQMFSSRLMRDGEWRYAHVKAVHFLSARFCEGMFFFMVDIAWGFAAENVLKSCRNLTCDFFGMLATAHLFVGIGAALFFWPYFHHHALVMDKRHLRELMDREEWEKQARKEYSYVPAEPVEDFMKVLKNDEALNELPVFDYNNWQRAMWWNTLIFRLSVTATAAVSFFIKGILA
ncbi:MAG: hypothetical protein J6Y62_07105 [Clostridia bacterium]|nr:hypothetical protein [Clostridia bacterium]